MRSKGKIKSRQGLCLFVIGGLMLMMVFLTLLGWLRPARLLSAYRQLQEGS